MEQQRAAAKDGPRRARGSATSTCPSTARCSSAAAPPSSPATKSCRASRRSRRSSTWAAPGCCRRPTEGDEVGIVLDITPFYAESGGQESDHGRIVFDGGAAEVLDVQTPVAGLIVHRARIRSGELLAGATVSAEVDRSRRAAVSRAHTATHLVHRAFRGRARGVRHPGRFAQRARAGCASTSTRRRPSPPRSCATSRTRSTRCCCAICRSARSSPRWTRRAGSARWRCSARSTAMRYASSTSVTATRPTPASSAAARTSRAFGAARGGHAAVGVVGRGRHPPRRGTGRARRLPLPGPRAAAAQPGRRRRSRPPGPRRCRSGSTTSSRGCATPSGSSSGCGPTPYSPAPARWRAAAGTSAASPWSRRRRPTAPAPRTCGPWRSTSVAGSATRPAVVVDRRVDGRQGAAGRRHQRGRALERGLSARSAVRRREAERRRRRRRQRRPRAGRRRRCRRRCRGRSPRSRAAVAESGQGR